MGNTRAEPPFERLLIRLPNWVGDILMALPAVQALRRHRPRARLVAMARDAHVELASRVAAFDHVVPAPPPAGRGRLRAWQRAVEALRSEQLQAALLLAPSFESALTARAAGIPVRVGHATDRRELLLTHSVPADSGKHRTDGFLDLAGALGAAPAPEAAKISFQAPEREYADDLFRQAGIDARERPVLVNPAAAKTPRAWSSDRFCRLAETIADYGDKTPLLVHNHAPFDPPASWPAHPSIHLVSGASLIQLGAVIERCRLYVGNDSGPMHLAAALGLPTVGIYGPSTPDHTSPRAGSGAPHRAVSARFACSPCRERFFDECPSPPTADGRPPCLDAVSVEAVAEQVAGLLRGD
ncbi:MAG: glycosyltransferase family 9 protein [Acidobacteria bacterium]|nr:glycosyltransferase family 9 protein [Acidobacteriota bacterium]